MEMDRFPRLRRGLFVVVVLFAFLVFPVLHIMWRMEPTHELDVLVYDVTVADDLYREHAVLDRIFANEKVPFALGVDHFGAAPGGEPFGQWPITQPDVIVMADGYGVYEDETGQISDFGRRLRSPLLTTDQASDVARWISDGVPAYGEFAFAPEPTGAEASELIQTAFGFDATGWLGHAEEDLSRVSRFITDLAPQPWSYVGPGIILVTTTSGDSLPDRQLVVLTEEHLDGLLPHFVSGPEGGRGESAPFDRWFELVEPSGAQVEGWLDLPVNEDGAKLLASAGIPARWPGVLSTPNTMYVVGDGLEDETGFAFRKFAHGDWLSWRFADAPDEHFFHLVLRPALERTIDLAVDRHVMQQTG